jgi:hypothetical protein
MPDRNGDRGHPTDQRPTENRRTAQRIRRCRFRCCSPPNHQLAHVGLLRLQPGREAGLDLRGEHDEERVEPTQVSDDLVESLVLQQPQADGAADLCQQRKALTSPRQLELGVDDQAFVGYRLQTLGQLAGEALGLLEVGRSPAQEKADDEDLGWR